MKHRYLAGMLAVAVACVVGCGRTDNKEGTAGGGGGDAHADHEEHATPETLPDAIAQLKEARTELGEAYVAGDVKEADHAFHEFTTTLKATRELIASSKMERYDSQDAQSACDEVSKLVGQLHPPHGADAKLDTGAYDGVKEELDAAITKLENAISKATEAAPATE
jgi:hypothetical protein